MIKELTIKDAAQVEKINRLACEAPYEVWLSNSAVILDARSLLGLYALVGQRVHVVTEDDINPKSLNRLVKRMSAE